MNIEIYSLILIIPNIHKVLFECAHVSLTEGEKAILMLAINILWMEGNIKIVYTNSIVLYE